MADRLVVMKDGRMRAGRHPGRPLRTAGHDPLRRRLHRPQHPPARQPRPRPPPHRARGRRPRCTLAARSRNGSGPVHPGPTPRTPASLAPPGGSKAPAAVPGTVDPRQLPRRHPRIPGAASVPAPTSRASTSSSATAPAATPTLPSPAATPVTMHLGCRAAERVFDAARHTAFRPRTRSPVRMHHRCMTHRIRLPRRDAAGGCRSRASALVRPALRRRPGDHRHLGRRLLQPPEATTSKTRSSSPRRRHRDVQDVGDEDPRVAKLYAQRRLPRGADDVICRPGRPRP